MGSRMKKCTVNGYFNGAMCGNILVGGNSECGLVDGVGCTYQQIVKRPTEAPAVQPVAPVEVPKPVAVKKKVLEKHVEAYLYKKMKKLGGECYKWSSTNMRGVADRICVFPPDRNCPTGIITLVELKKDAKAKLSPTQVKFHDKMAALRVPHVYVLHGKEEIDLWLKSMGHGDV